MAVQAVQVHFRTASEGHPPEIYQSSAIQSKNRSQAASANEAIANNHGLRRGGAMLTSAGRS